MPRKVQDIVPTNRRSIRDIPIEHVKETTRVSRAGTKVSEQKKEYEEVPVKRMTFTPPPPRKRKKSKKGLWTIIFLAVIVLIAGVVWTISSFFSHATFTIVPKTVSIDVDNTFVVQSATTDGSLSYNLVTIRGSATSTVPATDGKEVSTKAEGKMTIYNSYSSLTQRLVAGTRLANDSGKIYKLTDSIVVPGMTTTNGKKIPGSITTSVIAAEAGESYNIYKTSSQSDFKLLGFKGTAKYDAFYGRLNTDVTGGFVGMKKVVDQKILASTTQALHEKILASLLSQAKNSIKEGQVMYDNGYVINYSTPNVSGGNNNNSDVIVEGVLYAVAFDKTALSDKIAQDKATQTFGKHAYNTEGLETLSFTITNQSDFSPEKKNTLIIKLKGTIKLVGSFPIDEIKKKLAGMALSDTQKVFNDYAAVIKIEECEGEVVPPWVKVPTDINKISVVVNK